MCVAIFSWASVSSRPVTSVRYSPVLEFPCCFQESCPAKKQRRHKRTENEIDFECVEGKDSERERGDTMPFEGRWEPGNPLRPPRQPSQNKSGAVRAPRGSLDLNHPLRSLFSSHLPRPQLSFPWALAQAETSLFRLLSVAPSADLQKKARRTIW